MRKNQLILLAVLFAAACAVGVGNSPMPYHMRSLLKGKPDGTCVIVTQPLQLYPMKRLEKMPPLKYAAFIPPRGGWSKYNKSTSYIIRNYVSGADTPAMNIPAGEKLIYNGFKRYDITDWVFNLDSKLAYISLATTDGTPFMIPYYYFDPAGPPSGGASYEQDIHGLFQLCGEEQK
ncbi:MAG: hypothetical protein COV45_02690 [Deltaproteobacteria bacterium CG11_big_fil_rev_8_21_14_0_20_47_16]|nr:MAG: hypothetical protein COV45_02690 [Deltaproteobacteria bacterium CG11_big_fil_rev_8_21_14_0_20_47_16]